jgi:hypothetical protein
MVGSVKNPALGVNLRVVAPAGMKVRDAFFQLNLLGQLPITYSASVTPKELSNGNAIFRRT